jgi:hypothetical protein
VIKAPNTKRFLEKTLLQKGSNQKQSRQGNHLLLRVFFTGTKLSRSLISRNIFSGAFWYRIGALLPGAIFTRECTQYTAGYTFCFVVVVGGVVAAFSQTWHYFSRQ